MGEYYYAFSISLPAWRHDCKCRLGVGSACFLFAFIQVELYLGARSANFQHPVRRGSIKGTICAVGILVKSRSAAITWGRMLAWTFERASLPIRYSQPTFLSRKLLEFQHARYSRTPKGIRPTRRPAAGLRLPRRALAAALPRNPRDLLANCAETTVSPGHPTKHRQEAQLARIRGWRILRLSLGEKNHKTSTRASVAARTMAEARPLGLRPPGKTRVGRHRKSGVKLRRIAESPKQRSS